MNNIKKNQEFTFFNRMKFPSFISQGQGEITYDFLHRDYENNLMEPQNLRYLSLLHT